MLLHKHYIGIRRGTLRLNYCKVFFVFGLNLGRPIRRTLPNYFHGIHGVPTYLPTKDTKDAIF